MFFHKRFIFIIILFLVSYVSAKNNCTPWHTGFGEQAQLTIQCFIMKSVPSVYCSECVKPYVSATFDYSLINEDPECRKTFINNNRMNVLQSTYNYITHEWNKGFCDDCFEWNEDHTNVTGNSNSTLNFYDQVSKFDMCISNAKKDNENVCIKCNDTYDQLNQFYDNLSITKLDKICFDIQDKINKTRIDWSTVQMCCKDKRSSPTAFIIVSSCIGSFPIFFYITFIFYAKKEERRKMLTAVTETEPEQNENDDHNLTQSLLNNLENTDRGNLSNT